MSGTPVENAKTNMLVFFELVTEACCMRLIVIFCLWLMNTEGLQLLIELQFLNSKGYKNRLEISGIMEFLVIVWCITFSVKVSLFK